MNLPKIHTYSLIVMLGFLAFYANFTNAQAMDARVILFDKMEEIKPFKSLVKSYELKTGEELLMNVEVVGGKKLSRLTIEMPANPFKMQAKKIRRIERGGFLVSKDGNYNLIFRNKGIFKKNVRIKIEKYPKKSTRDTIILEDIIVTTTVDTLRNAFADTTSLPDISEKSFELQPSLDFKSKSDSCLTELLIDGEKYQFAVYWIGVGASAKKEYDKLKASPPPSWTLQGVNEPLFAFGMGLTQKLPASSATVAKSVRFAFCDPNAESPNLSLSDANPAYFGVIPVYKAGKYQKVKLCFRNFNTTTKAPVYLMIAKYKLDKKENLQIIKRERVQEIFIRKAVEFYEIPEE